MVQTCEEETRGCASIRRCERLTITEVRKGRGKPKLTGIMSLDKKIYMEVKNLVEI